MPPTRVCAIRPDWLSRNCVHDATLAERGFGFDFAALMFEGDTIEAEDARNNYGETRIQALGEVEGIVLFVVPTDRGDVR